MEQKRSGFVPLGDLALDLPGGRGLSPCAATPQAQRRFTTLHQIDQLVDASEADADLGFMARLLALCSLPRTNPGDRLQYVRRNGPYTLAMTASTEGVKLPYGNIPRLLLAWVCTEAVRTQQRELVLGRSLYKFMGKLGMEDHSGGRHGERARLRKPDELKSQGLQPGVEADRALASIANGALASIANGALAHMGITSERTHERDYDRDFGLSR